MGFKNTLSVEDCFKIKEDLDRNNLWQYVKDSCNLELLATLNVKAAFDLYENQNCLNSIQEDDIYKIHEDREEVKRYRDYIKDLEASSKEYHEYHHIDPEPIQDYKVCVDNITRLLNL